ncbi:glycosyltransferase family 4 protein [Alienimonas californiensis]|uniref:D-inositol 3-phosphate glycosyltransferase n=1 Tax=Alienimonas californiensis TaxID=2527989 RepID=A0A517P8M8_9PLAN|nr:glycosyltransferase family 4 protein [Alienimonas californiensis]QDT15726.1 D-inositol 3-phosphate glycosyltransferase [Alienimonas californiensis]
MTPPPPASAAPTDGPAPLRAVFLWSEINGYMAACFRELAGRADVDPYFLAFASGRSGSGAAFADDVVAGLPCRLLEPGERDDAALVRRLVEERRPDVVVLNGWYHRPYRRLPFGEPLRNSEHGGPPGFMMTFDTPWRGDLRQRLARFPLASLLNRCAITVVTGERSWQYGKRLGIPEARLRRGMYGVAHAGLTECLRRREDGPWPRRFLFVGRYADEKGLDVLAEAYARYREGVNRDSANGSGAGEPWTLECCGTGPRGGLIAGREGIEDRGFVQPSALRERFAAAGALVLPSRFDPWPLALVESAAAGLPILCTEACGSSVELVRPYYNGLAVATDDVAALARGLRFLHDRHADLPEYGRRSHALAAAYSAQIWADRYTAYLTEARRAADA